MAYQWTQLGIKEITNMYLYGQLGTPPDLTAENLVRPNLPPNVQQSPYQLIVDPVSFMKTGPGRFAFAGVQSELVRRFMSGEGSFAPTGNNPLTKANVLATLGIPKDTFRLQQYLFGDGKDDAASRSYIWNSSSFKVGDAAEFYVNADGSRYIKNFAVLPLDDNFDFSTGEDKVAKSVNPWLQARIDPWKIGRMVELKFDQAAIQQLKANASNSTYTLAQFESDKRNAQKALIGITDLPGLGVGLPTIVQRLWNAGVTKFFDADGRVIVYGTPGADTLNASQVKDLSLLLSPIGANIDESTGVRLIADGGKDTLIGGIHKDYLSGGEGFDTLDGGSGDDELHGGEGGDILKANAGTDHLYGEAGRDTFDISGTGEHHIHDDGKGETLIVDGDNVKGEWIFESPADQFSNGNLVLKQTPEGAVLTRRNSQDLRVVLHDFAWGDYGIRQQSEGEGPPFPVDANALNIDLSNVDLAALGAGGRLILGDYETILGALDDLGNPIPILNSPKSEHDVRKGSGGGDLIVTHSGDDIVTANGGNDAILGGAGSDMLYGGAGDDYIEGGSSESFYWPTRNPLDLSIEYKWFHFADGNDLLSGGEGNDTLRASSGGSNDSLSGGAGDDTLIGGAGNEALIGGEGEDSLQGGAGDDNLLGDTSYEGTTTAWHWTDAEGVRTFHGFSGINDVEVGSADS